MNAPDEIEPVVGWRAWRVVRQAGGLRLLSAVYDELWPVGEELVAACRKARGHAAPAARCTCGVYAAREVIEAAKHRVGRNDGRVVGRVVGEVALWGPGVEGPHGWRAGCAYPVRLWVRDEELVAGLAAYGIPVMLEPDFAPRRWPRPLSFAR